MYKVATVLALSLLLAVCLAVLTSAYFSRPVSRLNARLRRIAANDFSFDPEIEKPQDELGQIGRTVNEMSMSIQHLLHETEEMYTQRRNIEIALLQSQVNPHFLYNTLDSIRWMAVIQKNPGIASITHSLSNLLKNIAKGTQDKITLAEELGLLQDYIAIQAVRYVEMFTFVDEVPQELYDCRIVKLTLQPLVENAIFHGIEPTGECGTITLTGRAEGDELYLCVEDDGAGIEPERLATILTAESKRSGSSMNGIGIANVHKRLQLIYGRQYGLTVESEPGRYHKVGGRQCGGTVPRRPPVFCIIPAARHRVNSRFGKSMVLFSTFGGTPGAQCVLFAGIVLFYTAHPRAAPCRPREGAAGPALFAGRDAPPLRRAARQTATKKPAPAVWQGPARFSVFTAGCGRVP